MTIKEKNVYRDKPYFFRRNDTYKDLRKFEPTASVTDYNVAQIISETDFYMLVTNPDPIYVPVIRSNAINAA